MEAAVRRPRPPAGHWQASDQRLALPAFPVSRYHVAVALQPHAGISRRPHGAHAHTHRQGHSEPGQLYQVSPGPGPCPATFPDLYSDLGSKLVPIPILFLVQVWVLVLVHVVKLVWVLKRPDIYSGLYPGSTCSKSRF